jgi:hypothetical protein
MEEEYLLDGEMYSLADIKILAEEAGIDDASFIQEYGFKPKPAKKIEVDPKVAKIQEKLGVSAAPSEIKVNEKDKSAVLKYMESLDPEFEEKEFRKKEQEGEWAISTKADSGKIFNAAYKNAPKTEYGTLDYSDPEKIQKFRNDATSQFIGSNKEINKTIIPEIQKKVQPLLDSYISTAKEKYDLNDPSSVTQENIDAFYKDVNGYYSKLVNNSLMKDKRFLGLTSAFNNHMDENPILGEDYMQFVRDENTSDLWRKIKASSNVTPNVFDDLFVTGVEQLYRGSKNISTDLKKSANAGLAGQTAEKMNRFAYTNDLASKYGWENETEGYWIEDPTQKSKSFIFTPKFQKDLGHENDNTTFKPSGAIEGTWSEFQEKFKGNVKNTELQLQKNLSKILDEQLVNQAFDIKAFDKIMEGEDVLKNTVALMGEQLPQMGAAILTMGVSSGLQIGGGIYWERIQEEAISKRKKDTGEPVTAIEMISVLKNEKFLNDTEDLAIAGGFIGGQLERIGAGKALKPFVIKGTKSILRGGIKNFVKDVVTKGVNNTKNGLAESLTEVLQEVTQSVAVSGKLPEGEQLFKAGGTGFIVGAAFGTTGNVMQQSITEIKTINNMIAGKLNPKSAEAFYNAKIAEIDDLLTKYSDNPKAVSNLQEKRDLIIKAKEANIKIPSNFSGKTKEKILDLLVKKGALENKIQGKDKKLVEKDSNKIIEINQELAMLSATEQLTIKATQAGADVAGLEIIEAENSTEAQEKAGKNSLSLDANATGIISEDGRTIVIDKSKAAKFGDVNTAAHELLHAVLFKTLYSKNKDGEVVGNNVIRGLAIELDKKLAELDPDKLKNSTFSKRLALYKKDPSSIRAEEKLTLFADALFYGDIKFNEGVFTKIKDFVRRLLQDAGFKNISFNSEQDVYNFLKDYNRAIQKGKLGKAIKTMANEGAVVGKDIKRVKGPEAVPAAKSSRVELSEAAMEKSFAALNEIKTTEQFLSPKGQRVVYAGLRAMAQVKANKFNLSPDVKESLASEIFIMTLEDVTKNPYNPQNEKSQLSGYLNERVGYSLQDIEFADYKFSSLDNKFFNKTSNKQVEDYKTTILDDPAPSAKPEAPKYRKIKDSKIFPPNVINSVKNKLLQTVRVLKSKIDAITTINKSVKPIVAEIKKEMGKQGDIDIKTYMGTMKTGLKSNFLKAKKATLENAPTTWLATAMPFAVQKSVGGVFTDQDIKDPITGKVVGKVFKPNYTSDWQGKKIDRVKSSTDAAGNTSGNQFIRRLPNVDKNVSNEQYMTYILDKNGKLIAGRKESWSKMTAEEMAFEIFEEDINDANSELTKAFKNNQEARGVVLADNYAEVLSKDFERGNVKRSRSLGFGNLKPIKQNQWVAGKDNFINNLIKLNLPKATTGSVIKAHIEAYGDIFTKEEHIRIGKEFHSVLGPVRKVEKFEKKLKKDNQTLEEFLETIVNQKDFNESIVKLTGASLAVIDLWQVEGNVGLAQGFVIEGLKGMQTDAALALLKNTFQNANKVGKRDYSNTEEDFRADLFTATEIIPTLKAAGHDISSFTRTTYTDSKGKVFPRNIKVQSTINQEHLGNDFDTDESIKNADAAWEFTTKIMESLKNADPDIQAMVMASMNSGTSTSLRAAAPVLWRTSVLPYTKTNKYRYEHSLPARVVLALMYKNIINGDKSIDLDAVKKDYSVAIIPLEMDKAINNAGFQRSGAIGYVPGKMDPNQRYYNFFTKGYVQFALQSLVDSKVIVGQSYANYYNLKNKPKAKNKSIPPIIKPSKSSKSLNVELNNMIARQKGVKSEAVYSKVVARKKGGNKGKYKFFLPSTAEDFRGLTQYTFAGKGKQGEADQKFFEDNLVKPYLKGISAMESQKQALKNDYSSLLKMFPKIKKQLNKEIAETGFTNDQAIRVYLYNKSGFDVPGISKRDQKKLIDIVNKNENLKGFADGLQNISKKESWAEPSEYWDVGSVLKDLNELSENVSRKDYLEEFITNADQIFNEDNLNKVEALYGSRHREALEDIIRRMKSGSNRPGNPDRLTGAWLDWVNNSVGTIMFFNRRSALLQMLSFTNFVNWSDNNPLMAAKAFANQPAYWSAWAKIFNSDKLKQRRGGLKSDVQEQEIANQAKNAKDKYSAAVSYLLKIGFTPTQIADSMAIATGGATFLINRTNTYVKQGMSKADAEAKAFEDFSAISDETQQSGDPMLISKQQSSHLGRLILAFQNTPMQYTRLMKKAGQDLINRRGDAKTNISKIIYYGFVQNLIFSTLQNALFALLPGFDPDDEDEEKFQKVINTKQERIMNSMVDTILRGSGLAGAVVSTLKNTINEYYRQEEKGSFMADHTYTLLQLANVSPPIGSKLRKVYGSIQTKNFEKDVIAERGWNLDSPKYEVIGNLLSSGLNIPLDRAVSEVRGITEALDDRNTAYQRLALGLGWRTWDVNAKNEEHELIKTKAKALRKEEGKKKAAETRKRKKREKLAENKRLLEERISKIKEKNKNK